MKKKIRFILFNQFISKLIPPQPLTVFVGSVSTLWQSKWLFFTKNRYAFINKFNKRMDQMQDQMAQITKQYERSLISGQQYMEFYQGDAKISTFNEFPDLIGEHQIQMNPFKQRQPPQIIQTKGSLFFQDVIQEESSKRYCYQKFYDDKDNEYENQLHYLLSNLKYKSETQNAQYKHVFEQKQVRQKLNSNKKLPKNSNFLKHFIKRFVDLCLFKKYKAHFEGQPEILKEVIKFMKYQKQMYRKEKNWNNNLKSLHKIFGCNSDNYKPKKRSFILRKIAHAIIRQEMIPNIKINPQIKIQTKSAKSYIYFLKVLLSRLTNEQFINRIQSR